MLNRHCPKCGCSDIVLRTVNDRFRAVDSSGLTFEVALHVPVCRCGACNLCWQGQDALAAMEVAYQNALAKRSPGQATA